MYLEAKFQELQYFYECFIIPALEHACALIINTKNIEYLHIIDVKIKQYFR